MPRVPKSIRSTRQILQGSNHILQSLYTQSRDLLEIERCVRRELQAEVYVAAFKNNILSLTTPKGSVATSVRYRQRNIISSLRRQGIDVNTLKIKVLPRYDPLPEVTRERQLSSESASRLEETARYIDDEPLQRALLRLSRRGRTPGRQ